MNQTHMLAYVYVYNMYVFDKHPPFSSSPPYHGNVNESNSVCIKNKKYFYFKIK